jgi:hypothetical protein
MTRSTFAFVVSLSFFGCRYPEAGPAPHAPTREATPGGGPAALDEMDNRTPVPLLPMMANHQKQNMRDHLVAIQEIVQGVATNDFDVIEKAAKRIGYSDEMGQMCTHMGAGAPGFAEQSIRFHRTADRIAEAARTKERAKVLAALGTTLQTCTACHAVWKQRVVDDLAWRQVTAAHPTKAN